MERVFARWRQPPDRLQPACAWWFQVPSASYNDHLLVDWVRQWLIWVLGSRLFVGRSRSSLPALCTGGDGFVKSFEIEGYHFCPDGNYHLYIIGSLILHIFRQNCRHLCTQIRTSHLSSTTIFVSNDENRGPARKLRGYIKTIPYWPVTTTL